mmetsp:Transcript_59996/g.173753  ORF Transcript_59996/g.173753 Transcript_59996/m.173753 type:complete len:356 (-) Transcript_59996:380-1447(-)
MLLVEGQNAGGVLVDDDDGDLVPRPQRPLAGVPRRLKQHVELLGVFITLALHDFHLDGLLQLFLVEHDGALRLLVVLVHVRSAVLRVVAHGDRFRGRRADQLHLDLHVSNGLQDGVDQRGELDPGRALEFLLRLLELQILGLKRLRELCAGLCCLRQLRVLAENVLPPQQLPGGIDAELRTRIFLGEVKGDEAPNLLRSQMFVGAILLPDLELHRRQVILRRFRMHAPDLGLAATGQRSDVGQVGMHDEHPEEDEGQATLPPFDDVGADGHQDDEQPDVGEDGPGSRDREHAQLLDRSDLRAGDGYDADRGDAEQVEGRAADNGPGAQVAGREVRENADDVQEDLGRTRAQSHER